MTSIFGMYLSTYISSLVYQFTLWIREQAYQQPYVIIYLRNEENNAMNTKKGLL